MKQGEGARAKAGVIWKHKTLTETLTESPNEHTCKPQIPKQAPTDAGVLVHPTGDRHSTHIQQIHKISKPS